MSEEKKDWGIKHRALLKHAVKKARTLFDDDVVIEHLLPIYGGERKEYLEIIKELDSEVKE